MTVTDPAPSRLVAPYVFGSERFRGEWRRHVIHLVVPVVGAAAATVGMLVVVGSVERIREHLAEQAALLPAGAVLLWLASLAWCAGRVALWHYDRFVLTDKRVMVVSGIVARDVAMMPLSRVTDLKYQQSVLGRMLNFGTFVLESAGQEQALRQIVHLPRPNRLYLRVVAEMYQPAGGDMPGGGGQ